MSAGTKKMTSKWNFPWCLLLIEIRSFCGDKDTKVRASFHFPAVNYPWRKLFVLIVCG